LNKLPEWWPYDKPYAIMDCLEGMKALPDKCVDLVLTDPPYGINIGSSQRLCKERGLTADWDTTPIERDFFDEMFRISKNQIIWGGNYYELGPTRGFLIWDKKNDGRDFADCEFAWSSYDEVARIFHFSPINVDGGKVHPTQKPADLFTWILESHSEAQVVLDPFLGSGTTLLACRKTDRIGLGFEITPDYEPVIINRMNSFTPSKDTEDYF